MRVVCPHSNLRPETRAALIPFDAEFVSTAASPTAYWECLSALWQAGEGFLLVEHDMEPLARHIEKMAGCPDPWCAAPYWLANGQRFETALGFSKFSTELLTAERDLMAEVGEIAGDLPAKDWRRLDVRVQLVLRRRGYTPHLHDPVTHLNPNCRH